VVAILRQAQPEFRRMQADDLDRVAEIEALAYEFPWSRAIFADCLRAAYECIVLVDVESIVGYGVLSSGANEAHVLNVCVLPGLHGRGYGRRIVKRLLDIARWQRRTRARSRSTNRSASTSSAAGRTTTRRRRGAKTRS
jgi:ribosomal-protein-alanine N-acetyltransferase